MTAAGQSIFSVNFVDLLTQKNMETTKSLTTYLRNMINPVYTFGKKIAYICYLEISVLRIVCIYN
jgi:hypothetical protein